MGKKLSFSEKIDRIRENNLKQKKIEKRKFDNKKSIEDDKRDKQLTAENNVAVFQLSIDMLKRAGFLDINNFLKINDLLEVDKIELVSIENNCVISKKRVEYTLDDFNANPRINSLKNDSQIGFDVFKNTQGTFIEKVFFKNKLLQKFNEFKKSINDQIDSLSNSDSVRRSNFISCLKKYENLIDKLNLELENKLFQTKENFKKEYEKYKSEYLKYESELNKLIEKNLKNIDDVNNKIFQTYLKNNISLNFKELDSTFSMLIDFVDEIDEHYYKSPTENITFSVNFDFDSVHVFLISDSEYFPIENKQINILKEGYSVTRLSNKLRDEIEDSFIPSIMIGCALFGLKFSEQIKYVIVSHGINSFDRSTGNPVINWNSTKKFTRENLFSINYENIFNLFPNEIIAKIENESLKVSEKLTWYDSKTDISLPNELKSGIIKLNENYKHLSKPQAFQEKIIIELAKSDELLKIEKELLLNLIA